MRIFTALVLLCLVATTAFAHDLFFRMGSFFVTTNSSNRVLVLNGTFSSSENSVTQDRLLDLSVVSPSGRAKADTSLWSAAGDTSVFTLRTGSAEGTYVVGASLSPREITLSAKDFNGYLAEDGIPDVLAVRKAKGELGKPATERYAKHIKALVQVGAARSGDFAFVMGYPAELVPLDNPYSLRPGSVLRVRAMVDNRPVANQLVVSGGRIPSGARLAEQRVRTDANGVARITLHRRGQHYVKFIHMVPWTGADKLDYESKWATLTFELR
jgi:hypothetical protein